MLTTIQLHGSLGRAIGELWELDVSSLGEAVRAIETLSKKFCQHLLAKDKEGIAYQVLYDSYECKCVEDLSLVFQKPGVVVHVIPVIGGAEDAKNYGMLVGGLLLIGLAFVPGVNAFVGIKGFTTIMFSMGVMLALSGISGIINAPDENKDTASKSLSGSINSVKQGEPIPLAYGEIMIGSQVISCMVQDVDVSENTLAGTISGLIGDLIGENA
jgi:predicted phage tail protein